MENTKASASLKSVTRMVPVESQVVTLELDLETASLLFFFLGKTSRGTVKQVLQHNVPEDKMETAIEQVNEGTYEVFSALEAVGLSYPEFTYCRNNI